MRMQPVTRASAALLAVVASAGPVAADDAPTSMFINVGGSIGVGTTVDGKDTLGRDYDPEGTLALRLTASWEPPPLPYKEPKGYRVGGALIPEVTLGYLRVADRRSEHVACAGGEPVLAAGEMTLRMSHAGVEAEEVSNQSTGYCPEPSSWPAVEQALSTAGIKGPDGYTRRFVFRRCGECDQINLIKDGIYECDVCGAPLST